MRNKRAPAPADGTSSDDSFSPIDLHFGRAMSRLAGGDYPGLERAAALASRATGNGDVCVRLTEVAPRDGREGGESVPPLEEWLRVLRASPVVGAPGAFRPLVLDDEGRLYLHRYWDYEQRLAEGLLARAADADDVDEALLTAGLDRYFPDTEDAGQKLAAATAILRRLCVISGGPGTGKTTTVVKILALLAQQAKGRKLTIALAAPTGKAAARVQEAMRAAIGRLDLDAAALECIPSEAFTLHRLLGARPDTIYYRHDRDNPLALDALVVDEASMADLALAAKLVDALHPRTRLILLGDKDQLASVEAGAVLGDICKSGGYTARFAKRLSGIARVPIAKVPMSASVGSPMSDSIALLERSYRFGPASGIGTLARLVNVGHGAEALELLQGGEHADIAWRSIRPADLRAQLAAEVPGAWRAYFEAVHANAPADSLFAHFNRFRVLCAHRNGLFGVSGLNAMIEDILDGERRIAARETWYRGRPVMVTRNDYNARLYNGDVGLTVHTADGPRVVFPGAERGLRAVAPARLPEHETVYAMTLHKSQGSEFARVLVALPGELSPIMTRELIYTGITRAVERVDIWGDAAVFRAAVERRLTRASALQERLWRGNAPDLTAPA